MTSQAFLMTSFVKSFDRKSEKECLTKRNIANFFLISFKLGRIILWIDSVDWRSKTVLSVKLWGSNQADKI